MTTFLLFLSFFSEENAGPVEPPFPGATRWSKQSPPPPFFFFIFILG